MSGNRGVSQADPLSGGDPQVDVFQHEAASSAAVSKTDLFRDETSIRFFCGQSRFFLAFRFAFVRSVPGDPREGRVAGQAEHPADRPLGYRGEVVLRNRVPERDFWYK